MVKETVHIISHSHWDREWYLPFEEHRMRLVELFDDLFELFETDPDFNSFHLDGQLIVLEDYLAIRPQNRELLKKYIAQGKLIVGPFYILQDDFLISSEAHVRNHLIGHLESKDWGPSPKIGYYKEYYDQLDPAYSKGNEVNGKLYAVPVTGNVANQQMFSFNKELVDKYKFDISNVKNYEDLEPMLAVIKEKEPKITPMAYSKGTKVSDNLDYILGDLLPFVVDLEGDSTKIVNQFEVEHYVNRIKTVHEYYKKGYIPADVATSDAEFNLATPNWFVRKETQGPADMGDSLLTTVAGYPIVSKALTNAYKTSGSTQAANFVISSTSKHKKEAMKILNLLNTNKELLNGLVFGPEGTNWEKDSSKKDTIKLLKGYANDTRMSAWNTGNSQILYRTDKVTDQDVAQSEKVLKEAKESPALGFSFNTDPVKTEITRIQNIMNQYNAGIQTGTVDPEKAIPELMAQFNKEEAYAKVMKEMQKQYDEFLAKQ